MPKSYGTQVYQARKRLDLSQADLADRFGVGEGFVRRIENDELRPGPGVADRIADLLLVPVALLRDAPPARPVTPPAPPPGLTYAQAVRAARAFLDESQERTAGRLGISPWQLSRIETGDVLPAQAALAAIAAVLNVPPTTGDAQAVAEERAALRVARFRASRAKTLAAREAERALAALRVADDNAFYAQGTR